MSPFPARMSPFPAVSQLAGRVGEAGGRAAEIDDRRDLAPAVEERDHAAQLFGDGGEVLAAVAVSVGVAAPFDAAGQQAAAVELELRAELVGQPPPAAVVDEGG